MKHKFMLVLIVVQVAFIAYAHANESAMTEARANPAVACNAIALRAVSGLPDSSYSGKDYAELLEICNNGAPAACNATAIDIIEANGKKSPLHCKPMK